MRLRDEMPELEGATVWYNSEPIEKKDLIGHKPTLIHFWSVSCEICKQTMRNIQEFRNNYKNELHVIAVHMPRSNEDLYLEDVKNVARDYGISQPIYVDNNHRLTDRLGVNYVPAYFVFDEMGKLRHLQSGESTIRMVLKRIQRLI